MTWLDIVGWTGVNNQNRGKHSEFLQLPVTYTICGKNDMHKGLHLIAL